MVSLRHHASDLRNLRVEFSGNEEGNHETERKIESTHHPNNIYPWLVYWPLLLVLAWARGLEEALPSLSSYHSRREQLYADLTDREEQMLVGRKSGSV